MDYTLSELMVVAAAREIQDGDIVFVGMRLPLIAYVVAKNTHAPRAVGVFENGVLRLSLPKADAAKPKTIKVNATSTLEAGRTNGQG